MVSGYWSAPFIVGTLIKIEQINFIRALNPVHPPLHPDDPTQLLFKQSRSVPG